MATVTEDINYEVSTTDRLKDLNETLSQELTDLKNELEENSMVHGIERTIR